MKNEKALMMKASTTDGDHVVMFHWLCFQRRKSEQFRTFVSFDTLSAIFDISRVT
jgi:hypothetical protein